MLAFLIKYVSDAHALVIRMAHLIPKQPATRVQPRVQFGERAEALLARTCPDPLPTILHILLDDTLLPSAVHVAEARFEQIMRAHDSKSGIDQPSLAFARDLIDRRSHVVVDTAARHTTHRLERPCVRVKEHLVALAEVRRQPERP